MDPSTLSPEALTLFNQITAKGEEIKSLKAGGADKEALAPHISALLALKEQFKVANNGVAFDPPAAPKKEKVKAPPAQEEVKKEGPSKKELNKLAKKEKKKGGSSDAAPDSDEKAPQSTPVVPAASSVPSTTSVPVPPVPSKVVKSEESVSLYFHPSNPAAVTLSVFAIANINIPLVQTQGGSPHHPYLFTPPLGSISGDYSIARYLCRQHKQASHLLPSEDAWKLSQVDQWLDHCLLATSSSDPSNAVAHLVTILDTHLKDKTFAVGSSLTLADLSLFHLVKSTDLVHVTRWQQLIASQLTASPTPSSASREGKKESKGNKATKNISKVENDDDGTSCPPLQDAEMGKVVTRFPPEPSGYLHIGHSKAALLNQYYAERYKGKLIVRFDDTNPSKEKEEYADNIIRDLATLNIRPDIVTHTSDSFPACETYARSMIREGKAYMDDTDQEKMQAERMALTNSYRRDSSVEENLKLFEGLLTGAPEFRKFCLRAKIDMQSPNGTMRDPVLYRYNEEPHHRTGTKYKAYPTYDFACPIVDAIEGVTHALRTTEYNDRDEQYHWLQTAMGLRYVHIMTYGKISFVYTVLSKRKLNWFVEEGLVEGWTDARFPTIQGCIRRGMNVESLKKFIISQGASRRVINMEWDKFWSENKKVLEGQSARYMAVTMESKVLVKLLDVPAEVVVDAVQIHPQKPEMGVRPLRKYNEVYLELEDCKTFSEGEEVTLMRWGNFLFEKISQSEGTITEVEARYLPKATNFSKTKKVTWIAAIPDLVPCELVEFDHLINQPLIKDGEDFRNFVTPVSRVSTSALADPCLRTTQKGEVVQLERKGFFRVDRPYGGSPDKPAVLYLIPDGRTKSMSTLSSALTHR